MSIDPDFNPWRYLVTVAKVTASLVLVIVPVGWAAIQAAQAIGSSDWVRTLVVRDPAGGVPLDAGSYALATAPVAGILGIVFVAIATLAASIIYAIVGPRRQRRKLAKKYELALAAADSSKREELAAAEERRREELAAAEDRRREDLIRADTQKREALAAAENLRREELAAVEDRRREETQALTKDYDEVIDRLKRLTEFLYSETGPGVREKPSVVIRSQSTTHEILADYDGRAIEYYEIEAADEPAHFWKIWVLADAESDAVRTHGAIGLSARFTAGEGSVIAVPTSNRLREKEFALFFTPPIAPGERRMLKLEYRWPGYWKQLAIERNVDYFTRATDRLSEKAKLELNFNFYGESRDVLARDLGPAENGSTLSFEDHQNMRTWRYVNSAWRVDGTEYRIKFSRPHGTAERGNANG